MTTSILNKAWKARLKPDQKLVLLHIANNQAMPELAVPLDVARCADFAGIPSWRVAQILMELSNMGKIRYSERQEEIMVVIE